MKLNQYIEAVVVTFAVALTFPAFSAAMPFDEHYQNARVALDRGDVKEAAQELRMSLLDNPLHAQSHLMLASLLGQEGKLNEAIVGFQQALTLEPNDTVARYNLGTALLWRGQPVAAARLFEETIALRPDYIPPYNNLAKAYFLAGLPELAVASYEEVLTRDPSNRIARENLALFAQNAKAPDSGIAGTPSPATPKTIDSNPPTRTAAVEVNEELASAARALKELLRDLPHVEAEPRGDRVVVNGWTSSPSERALLDRILEGRTEVLDLSTDDVGDPHRLLEVDTTIFTVIGLDSENIGHNFLKRVEVNASLFDGAMASFDWLYSAAISYEVNIANAVTERVAFLARPHLTTLSGTPATFLAGGDIVYQVAGLNSGDIKPYPFGTSLEITPTLLRTAATDGSPRVRLAVKAGRKSILPLQGLDAELGEGSTVFENIEVTSEAVLDINQTLILTGLNQREQRSGRSGVPGLKSIPVIKYLFSTKITRTSDLAIIILLTPRDPAYWDEKNRTDTEKFVEKRRAFVEASKGTEEDMKKFKEDHPGWEKLAPNRLASHFFLMENSAGYRAVSGVDIADENLDFELLGKK